MSSRNQGNREFEGANLEEALHKAAKEMKIDEPELDYEILEQGRRGLWGIGHKSVRIRVMPPIQPAEAIDHSELTTASITGRRQSRSRGGRGRGGRSNRGGGRPDANRRGDGNREADGNREVDGNRKAEGNRQKQGAEGGAEAPREGRRRSRSRGGRGRGRQGGQGGQGGQAADGRGRGSRRSGERRGGRDRGRRSKPEPERAPVTPEEAAKVETGLQQMVDLMGLELKAEIRELGTSVSLDLKGADEELLNQNGGEAIASLEFLLNRMSRRSWPEAGRIYLGSEGARTTRDEDVVGLVREVADQVLNTGNSKRLHSMNSYERRLTHITVREYSELGSRSEGDGPVKRVRIFKKKS